MESGTKGLSRRMFLGLAGAVLAGCAFPNQGVVETSGFGKPAYDFLVGEFKRKGLHNLNSPLFDFSDKEVRQAYKRMRNTPPGVIQRDLDLAGEIEQSVERHLDSYGDRSLVLISGAAFHIYGAVGNLERRFGVEYLSMTPKKLGFSDVILHNTFLRIESPEEEARAAIETTGIQLRRAIGVVKYYGYADLRDFVRRASRVNGAKNIAVGIEETGLHDLYTEKEMVPVYEVLGEFIDRFKPRSLLYLREGFQLDIDKGRIDFLNKASDLGITIAAGEF